MVFATNEMQNKCEELSWFSIKLITT
jgi:hypothetical protein